MYFSRFSVGSVNDYIFRRNIFIHRKRLSKSTELIGAYFIQEMSNYNTKILKFEMFDIDVKGILTV